MTPQFIDASAYQGNIDFAAYCAWARQWDGISRIALKATEGVGFTDPSFAANRAKALAAGIDQIFYYHFARPDLGNSPANEANWCHDVVGNLRDNDMIMLDYEVENPLSGSQWAYEWLTQQKAIYGGKLPGIYASSAYIQERLQDPRLNAFPLWLANWQFTPDERPPAPWPWTSYEAVQYTDRAANIPGIAGQVDVSIFLAGGTPVNNMTYGPNSADFHTWFTVDPNGNFSCKQTGATIIGGNLALYQQLSMDGQTLPAIGLPVTSEQYIGAQHSLQRFERAVMVYDAADPNDRQPGMGASHLAFVDYASIDGYAKVQSDLAAAQAQITALQAQITANIPAALKADLEQLPAALQGVATKLQQDAGLPTT